MVGPMRGRAECRPNSSKACVKDMSQLFFVYSPDIWWVSWGKNILNKSESFKNCDAQELHVFKWRGTQERQKRTHGNHYVSGVTSLSFSEAVNLQFAGIMREPNLSNFQLLLKYSTLVLNFAWKSKDFCDIEEYWDTLIFRSCFIWALNESQSWYWSCCLIHSLANHCQLEKPHYQNFPKQSFHPTFSQVLEASLFSTCHFSSKSWNFIFSKEVKGPALWHLACL